MHPASFPSRFRRSCNWPRAVCALVVVGCLARLAAATDGARLSDLAALAQHVPGDASLVVLSADVAATCSAFQDTTLGQTVCGPDFAPLLKELERRDLATPLRMRPTFGVDWSDLARTRGAGGFVAFALPDGSLGSAWLFAAGESAKQPALTSAATAYFKQKGYTQVKADRAGALHVLKPPAAAKDVPSRATLVTGQCYAIASSQAAAEVLAAVGASKSLAAQTSFTTQALGSPAKTAHAGDVCIYMRPLELERLMRPKKQVVNEKTQASAVVDKKADGDKKTDESDSREEEDTEDSTAKAHRLGWDALESLAGWIRFKGTDPCEWQIDATLQAGGPYRGVLQMLELKSGPLGDVPTWITPNVTGVSTWRWDFARAIQGFGSLFDEANQPGPDGEGMFEDILDGLRDDPEGVQVDLRRGLFDLLSPEMIRANEPAADKPEPRESDPQRWIYVAHTKNQAAVKDTLVKFYKGDERVRRGRVGSYDTWTVDDDSSLFIEGESTSVVSVRSLALGEGALLFSTDAATLEAAIGRRDGPSLRDDAAWKALSSWMKAHETAGASLRSFVRLDQLLGPAYRSATSEPFDSQALTVGLWSYLLYGSSQPATELPYQSAPRFEQLRAALPPAALILSRTESGWLINFGALGTQKPPVR